MPGHFPMPSDWHHSPSDGFHGRISTDGPFKPETDRYHLYIGLFCPFAQRVNLAMDTKRIKEHANIGVSIVRPYSLNKGDGKTGLTFNVTKSDPDSQNNYPGATKDNNFGSTTLRDVYLKADPVFEGRASVPMLWDRKLDTIVNNESADLLRQLQTCFDPLLPKKLQDINLYPDDLKEKIDSISPWIHRNLNLGVYQVGFASTQQVYQERVLALFSAVETAERLVMSHTGPFVLGKELTILDVQLFATIVRFDAAYVQAFRCNLKEIRHDHPTLNAWLKTLFWNSTGKTASFKETTDFEHIKDFYFKNFPEINPKLITPIGPSPSVETMSF